MKTTFAIIIAAALAGCAPGVYNGVITQPDPTGPVLFQAIPQVDLGAVPRSATLLVHDEIVGEVTEEK